MGELETIVRLESERQKFLGDDECPVQKKKFSPRGLRPRFHARVLPDNFSCFDSASQNEVAGVTI